MRICVPLFGDRVAPRCTHADNVLLCAVNRGRIVEQERFTFPIRNLADLEGVLRERKVDTLICGGINRDDQSVVDRLLDAVVPNVAGTVEEVLLGIRSGQMGETVPETQPANGESFAGGNRVPGSRPGPGPADCLQCISQVCLEGKGCRFAGEGILTGDLDDRFMLEVARDLNCEDERRLCRLSELVYFGLEMGYRRIGIAYCSDLHWPATVLAGVLKRFFDVRAICCKFHVEGSGPVSSTDLPDPSVRCNPLAQAKALNDAGTDLNVIVGLCMGADCVFTRASDAPVTTLFSKDRALANNPIGAVYSERYLREAERALGAMGSFSIQTENTIHAFRPNVDREDRERVEK